MRLFDRMKSYSTQPFAPRSDGLNWSLRSGQGLVIAGLGAELHHVGLAAPIMWGLVAVVCGVQGVAMIGWKREMARHVAAAA